MQGKVLSGKFRQYGRRVSRVRVRVSVKITYLNTNPNPNPTNDVRSTSNADK